MKALTILILLVTATAPLCAQSTAGQGSRPAFDVASIKQNKSSNNQVNSNFPLGPGDVYVPNGGYLSASNFPLITYIFFAYKIMGNQGQYLIAQLPKWVSEDRFDIQARAEGNPTKDEMRHMMRSLLADRFKLAVHTENREVPVLAFVLLKPGKTGPQLQLYPADSSCTSTAPAPSAQAPPPPLTGAGGFPTLCGGIFGLPPSVPGRVRAGARDIKLSFVADSMSALANLGRPIVDKTGIDGTVDFTLEWAPEKLGAGAPNAQAQAELSGPTFTDALREQLGIKLESQKGPLEVIVLDHIEHPSEN